MSYNGSGAFLINTAGQPVSANTLITATAFNALTADIATGLSTAITKDGQTTVTANIPMGGFRFTGLGAGSSAGQSLRYEQLFSTSAVQLLGAMEWVKGADIASAATVNLTTATGNGVHITGTTTITAVTLGSGMWRLVVFDGALTLTHHATNNNLPGASNITTAAGDRALYWSDGTTVYCAAYMKASGKATVAPAVGDVTGLGTGVATALAVNVGSAGAPVVNGGALGTPSSGTLTNCTGLPAAGLVPSTVTNTLGADVALNNTATYFTGPSCAQGTSGTWLAVGVVTVTDTSGAGVFEVRLTDGTTVLASTRLSTTTAGHSISATLVGVIASPAGNIKIEVRDTTSTSGAIKYNYSTNSKDSTLTVIRIG